MRGIWGDLAAGAGWGWGGIEFAKACGMKPDGDCRELLAEVQGEERLRGSVSQITRAVSASLSSLGFILEAMGSQDKFLSQKRDTTQCAMYAF